MDNYSHIPFRGISQAIDDIENPPLNIADQFYPFPESYRQRLIEDVAWRKMSFEDKVAMWYRLKGDPEMGSFSAIATANASLFQHAKSKLDSMIKDRPKIGFVSTPFEDGCIGQDFARVWEPLVVGGREFPTKEIPKLDKTYFVSASLVDDWGLRLVEDTGNQAALMERLRTSMPVVEVKTVEMPEGSIKSGKQLRRERRAAERAAKKRK